MLSVGNMTNPISSVAPDFGMLTLKHGVSDITSMRHASSISHDTVDRGQFQGDVSKELSARELAKEFG